MDFQSLCELADREIKLGVPDEALMRLADAQAGGLRVEAEQIYWRLRASAIQAAEAKSPGSYISELKTRIEQAELKKKRRESAAGWFRAVICIGCFAGAYAFPRIAMSRSIRGSLLFYALVALGVGCLVAAGILLVANKRRHSREP